jgi:hypothetical protein
MCTNIRVALVAALVPPFHPFSNPHTHRTDAHAPSRLTPENNTTPATQIIVSLLGRLSKGLLDADKGRRPPKPSVPQTKHHPSQVHQVGNRCCFYFVSPFASQGICTSVNQSLNPRILSSSLPQHTNIKLKRTIPLSFRLSLLNTLAWPAFWPFRALISYH